MDKKFLYDHLKQKIVNEEISPGTWLVEREISKNHNVSRTPVREVLRTLATDGLITQEPSKGYYVRKLNFEELVEIFHAREGVEGMLTRLACTKSDELFLDKIHSIRDQLKEIDIETNPPLGVEIGHSLHNVIVTQANSEILGEFYQKLNNLTQLTRNITKMSASIELSSRNDHIEIADALLKRDEIQSEHFMRKHIRSTCKLLSKRYLIEHTGFTDNFNG